LRGAAETAVEVAISPTHAEPRARKQSAGFVLFLTTSFLDAAFECFARPEKYRAGAAVSHVTDLTC
jgi:hypothetical protein